MVYLWLLAGFVLLIKGADYFVDGASAVARRLNIPSVIIGLTIVALGTSLPEAAVSISASLAGSNALAISNVVGSNVFNTLVVVGASALMAPFAIERTIMKRDLSFNILVTLLLFLAIMTGTISRWMGIGFLILLAVYLYILLRSAREETIEPEKTENMPVWKMLLFLLFGAAAIILGGNVTVNSARDIAAQLGMTENLIGLTVVAVGTSLPELVTSITAAKKGESGLSLGNAIGSNILNILFILGLSATIHPLTADPFSLIDVAILLVIAVVLFAVTWTSPKMTRFKGGVMIAAYIGFMAYTILR